MHMLPLRRPILLVVDDMRVIHTIVDHMLRDFPGTILHAYDGGEAMRIARDVRPDILLADALLPGIDGRDVARLLKSNPATAHVRAIVMTAFYKGLRYRTEAIRDFLVDAYIEKPMTATQLREVVGEMLQLIGSEAESIAS
jgi:CheY-like chemotaxis protein